MGGKPDSVRTLVSVPAPDIPTLPRYSHVIIRYWWVILASILLVAGGALAWHFASASTYTAVARLTVNPYSPDNEAVQQVAGLRFQSLNDPFEDAALMANSRTVLVPAARRVGANADPLVVQREVLVTPVSDTSYLNVVATQTDPRRAQALANAVAEEFLDAWAEWQAPVIEEVRDRFIAAREELGDDDSPVIRETRALYTRQIAELNMLATRPNGVIQLREPALIPLRADGLGALLTGIIGALAGALLGLVLAFLLAGRNRRLRRPQDVIADTGLPILASVSERDAPPTLRADFLASTRARGMRGALTATKKDEPRHGSIIAVAHAAPRDLYVLGRTLAEKGASVLVVASAGDSTYDLGRVLRGEVPLAEVVRATSAERVWALSVSPSGDQQGLGLSRAQAQQFGERARALADWVLVDLTAPDIGSDIAVVADQVVVAAALPGVRRRTLAHRIAALREHGARISGVLLITDATRRRTE